MKSIQTTQAAQETSADERAAAQDELDRSRLLVLPSFTGRTARLHADKPALVFGSEQRTHGQLDDRASRLAGALADRGVEAGDRVALLLHNGFELVEALLACHKLGACAVPVNFRLVSEEVRFILDDSGAVGMICGDELAAVAADASVSVRSVRFRLRTGTPPADADSYEAALGDAAPQLGASPAADSDPALIMYTSGTTGRPKGAVLSHRGLVLTTLSWIHEMQAGHDDVWLSGQPLFHIGGINGLLPFLVLGATSVLTPTTGFDPTRAIELLEAHAVTMCIFVPTQWEQICTSPASASVDRGRLRVAMWGASPAPLPTLELMARTFPGADIVSAYGQTEMSGATTLLKGPDSTRKMGSVGKPMLGVELRLVDDDDRDVPAGAVGEIVYRGPAVMSGYHANHEATREAFAGGWFHSGDLAARDDEGYLRLVDRKKDMIVSGGENVYPAEVERALVDHPGVADVAVVGVPHPRWVETPLAFVVARDGAAPSAGELIDHCRSRLAAYKKPSAVVFVNALPRNAAGKVLRRQLREQHLEHFTTP